MSVAKREDWYALREHGDGVTQIYDALYFGSYPRATTESGSANAVTQQLGSDFANFDDYISEYNGGSAGLLFGAHLRTRLYVNNATNEQGISVAGPVLENANLFPQYREAYVIRPRTIGISLTYSFA
jgi:hypothetical protein